MNANEIWISIILSLEELALFSICIFGFLFYMRMKSISSFSIFLGIALMTISKMESVHSILRITFIYFEVYEKYPAILGVLIFDSLFLIGMLIVVAGAGLFVFRDENQQGFDHELKH